MDVNLMARKQFEKLPYRNHWDEAIICDSLVILPIRTDHWGIIKYEVKMLLSERLNLNPPDIWEVEHLHDSGYRRMDFVAVIGQEATCRLAGGSDVVHIEGIGGFGHNWSAKNVGVPDTIPVAGWNIDCLRASGLLRLFPNRTKRIWCGPSLSSFEIYTVDREDDD